VHENGSGVSPILRRRARQGQVRYNKFMANDPKFSTPLLLRGDVLNWLRPECVLRPASSAINRRARVALHAVDVGRVALSEPFLRRVLERLVEHPDAQEMDQIVADLKSEGHEEVLGWPYRNISEQSIALPCEGSAVVVDVAAVSGGSLAVLMVDVEKGIGSSLSSQIRRWQLVWVDLTSMEVEYTQTIAGPDDRDGPVLLAQGYDESSPVALLHDSDLYRCDPGGSIMSSGIPVLNNLADHVRLSAAALHPDTGELLLAVQEADVTTLTIVRRGGEVMTLARYPGQIDSLTVGSDLIVGMGMRDLMTVSLSQRRTSLRDLHPYFADQTYSGKMSAAILPNGKVLVQEGRKILCVSYDLRLVENEFYLQQEEDWLLTCDDRLIRVRNMPEIGSINIAIDEMRDLQASD